MPTNWGNSTNRSGSISALSAPRCRMVAGIFPAVSGAVLQSVSASGFRSTSPFTADARIAVYVGGTSNTDPTGATLLEDLGIMTFNGASLEWETVNSTTFPIIPASTRVWIAIKNATTSISGELVSPASGDLISNARSITGGVNLDENIAWDATLPTVTSIDVAVQMAIYLTYEVSSGAMRFDVEPSNSWTAEPIKPAVVVEATTDGTTIDTGFTGNITITKATGTGTLSGTATVAATAGVATFSNLIITGSGPHTLQAAGTGYDAATSASFKVATGTGVPTGTLIATESDMQYDMRALSATGITVELQLVDADGNPAVGLVFGDVSCASSVDGGTATSRTLVNATLGSYTSLGFKEISASLRPGAYAFGVPTLPASGKRTTFTFTGASIRKASYAIDLLSGDDGRASAATAVDIASEVLLAAAINPIAANAQEINGATVIGDGTTGNKWRAT